MVVGAGSGEGAPLRHRAVPVEAESHRPQGTFQRQVGGGANVEISSQTRRLRTLAGRQITRSRSPGRASPKASLPTAGATFENSLRRAKWECRDGKGSDLIGNAAIFNMKSARNTRRTAPPSATADFTFAKTLSMFSIIIPSSTPKRSSTALPTSMRMASARRGVRKTAKEYPPN